MTIALKRAYDKPAPADGTRVLVDRLWPRGLSKDAAAIKLWLKDVAPSNELRKWYHERPSMWMQFRERYLKELSAPAATKALEQLAEISAEKKLTLVYASKNLEHNNAVVLKELLEGTKKPPHKVKREPAATMPIAAQRSR